MKVKVKYFGLIAEALGVHEEDISIEGIGTENLIYELKNKYVQLDALEYQVALNHTLIKYNHQMSEGAEVALLPPFAGG